MNAQPTVDPEDVVQRMAREVGTVTAEKVIAESARDAALRQAGELMQQVADAQAHINSLVQDCDDLRADAQCLRVERDELREQLADADRALGLPSPSRAELLEEATTPRNMGETPLPTIDVPFPTHTGDKTLHDDDEPPL